MKADRCVSQQHLPITAACLPATLQPTTRAHIARVFFFFTVVVNQLHRTCDAIWHASTTYGHQKAQADFANPFTDQKLAMTATFREILLNMKLYHLRTQLRLDAISGVLCCPFA